MKKFLMIIIAVFLILQQAVKAEVIPHKIYAASEKAIEGNKISQNSLLKFITIDEYKISETIKAEKNSEITLKVLEYIAPKRGKRNGYLKVRLETYTIPSKKEVVRLQENLEGTLRPSVPKDIKDIAENTGVAVAGHFLKVPGFTQAIAVSKGLIKPNENENRLQSAGKNLYQSTPLKYVEKGADFNIEPEAVVVISIKEHEANE